MGLKKVVYAYRTVKHGFKFAKKGKHCRFPGKNLTVEGHVELGDNCRFRDNVILRTRGKGKIIFDTYSGLSFNCLVEATTMVKIGRFTGLAEYTVVRDTNHMVFGTDAHWRLTPHLSGPIVIGDCVVVMSNCYIMPGIAIGDGAVIGQHSVVTKDVGPYEVWWGNPARKIGHRLHGVVAESMKRKYGHLLDAQGLKETRYDYDDKDVREAAAAGINRAADERDRLIKELHCEAFLPREE